MGFKGMYDVNSYTDFWSWLSNGLVPLIFVQGRGFSEDFFNEDAVKLFNYSGIAKLQEPWYNNNSKRGLYIGHNRIVGGIRLSQERQESGWECASPHTLNDLYNI